MTHQQRQQQTNSNRMKDRNSSSSKGKHNNFLRLSLPGNNSIVLGKPAKKNSENNEFGTICLWTPPPTINSEKSNSENWSQSIYPPSLKK